MIRRQYVLIVVFTVIFQIFFSTSNILPLEPGQAFNVTLTTAATAEAAPNASDKCESTSIDEFPPLFFTNEQRRRGGILVHIALILYSFAAIEIVCDDYFASALERISCNFNLTPVGHCHLTDLLSNGVDFPRMWRALLSWLWPHRLRSSSHPWLAFSLSNRILRVSEHPCRILPLLELFGVDWIELCAVRTSQTKNLFLLWSAMSGQR